MSSSRNEARTNIPTDVPEPQTRAQQGDPLSFAVPTELVDIPSRGKFYSEEHPLHNVETVEMRFMTAKEEDILTSQSLIKKGIVVDRLLQSLIVDKRINLERLLIGDKNALVVAARISGYGNEYETRVSCPACDSPVDFMFDLDEIDIKEFEEDEDLMVSLTENSTFRVELPRSRAIVEVKPLTGADERFITQQGEKRKKNKLSGNALTTQLKRMICSVNGEDDQGSISKFVDSLPAFDSRFLRGAYTSFVPDIDMKQDFTCSECNHEQTMEVPLTADFFWPR